MAISKQVSTASQMFEDKNSWKIKMLRYKTEYFKVNSRLFPNVKKFSAQEKCCLISENKIINYIDWDSIKKFKTL